MSENKVTLKVEFNPGLFAELMQMQKLLQEQTSRLISSPNEVMRIVIERGIQAIKEDLDLPNTST